ncbi:GMC family oxidoreductase [uncultured Devosia sp.]|uniref:GMC family oxidoreductase n=1 Tax=uncultured Devosia sp. TaxID=211434 RepID=UPI0035CB9E8D
MDYLILGGGSAGCVLAARLSEIAANRVTLVEAGRNLSAQSMAPHVRSRYPGLAYADDNNIWPDLKAYLGAPVTPGAARSARKYEQGRLLGGGSAVNAMVANRGAPADYDEWVALGAPGWSFDEVLPYFRKLERDVDFDGAYHGKDGPIPIRRISDARMSPFAKGVIASLKQQSFVQRPDQNADWVDGIYVGAVAVSDDGERVPTSVAYLSAAVRARPNLTILTEHLAERLVLDGRKAVGAVVTPFGGGAGRTLRADEVIVASGAIHSPALLMRSGIGPGAALQALGIDVALDRPGVGGNLMEHASTAVSTYLPPSMRMRDLNEHHDHAILRFTSDLPDAPPGDLHAAFIGRSGWHSIGQRVGTLFIWLNKPFSRGRLDLASADPRVEPVVDFNLLADPRDVSRLMHGFRVGAGALTHEGMLASAGPAFPTSYSARVAALGVPSFFNTLQRGAFSGMLDWAGPARAWLIHNVVTLGLDLNRLMRDDAALADFLKASVGGVWHASGTLKMGRAHDSMAVTGHTGLVHGIDNLRVVDASLMPSIPRANTNTPTIMMAEKIAAEMVGRG